MSSNRNSRPGIPGRQRSRTSPFTSHNPLPDTLLPQLLNLMPQSYLAEQPSPRDTDMSEGIAANPLLPRISPEGCEPALHAAEGPKQPRPERVGASWHSGASRPHCIPVLAPAAWLAWRSGAQGISAGRLLHGAVCVAGKSRLLTRIEL